MLSESIPSVGEAAKSLRGGEVSWRVWACHSLEWGGDGLLECMGLVGVGLGKRILRA